MFVTTGLIEREEFCHPLHLRGGFNRHALPESKMPSGREVSSCAPGVSSEVGMTTVACHLLGMEQEVELSAVHQGPENVAIGNVEKVASGTGPVHTSGQRVSANGLLSRSFSILPSMLLERALPVIMSGMYVSLAVTAMMKSSAFLASVASSSSHHFLPCQGCLDA